MDPHIEMTGPLITLETTVAVTMKRIVDDPGDINVAVDPQAGDREPRLIVGFKISGEGGPHCLLQPGIVRRLRVDGESLFGNIVDQDFHNERIGD